MTGRWWHHERLRNGAGYALTAALSVALLARFLHLWNADLTVPLYYNGDSIFTAMQVRTVLDHGWYLKNPRVGMPQGGEMYDFPLPETVHFALLKLLGLCGCNCIVAINLYYLLSYPLTALTSYLVLRHFGCGRLGALVASLLFAFIPYHFYRSIRHLFLACYYLVPLMVMVVLWVYGEPGLLFSRREGEERMRLTPFSWRVLAGVVVCLLSASAGAYYAFFTCFFLAVAGLFRAATLRRPQPLLSATFFSGLIIGGSLINLAPNLLYTHRHGTNPLFVRSYVEAETFALRLTQLVLPAPDHRLRPLRELRARYDRGQQPYEFSSATLGIVGSAGFLMLLARLLYHRSFSTTQEVEDGLVLLNGSGVLLATMGGFSSLFALLATPAFRAYTRISIFLAFFALFAVVLLVEKLWRRYGRAAPGRWLLRLALLLLLAVGLYDQTTPALVYLQRPASVRARFHNDAAFVQAIEDRLPAGAMVFQLPYFPFPEVVPPGKLVDYDHFRGYLLSQSLRWSYGAMKGRAADAWQASVAAMPLEQMVSSLVFADFSGIYVDREGYDDRGRKLEADLRHLLGVQPLESADGRLVFFDLTTYAVKKRSEMVSPLSNSQARPNGLRHVGQDRKEEPETCQASRG